jgi:hypothetical protein
MKDNIEIQKLKLEERRLEEDMKLRKIEIDLKREQFEAEQRAKGFLARIFSPIGVAVIVGIIGLIGTAASGLLNVWAQRDKQAAELNLESKKSETSLILKMSEIPDEKQRALNLLFFAEGGYLEFSTDYKKYLREKAGLSEGEKIPPPAIPPTTLIDIPSTINEGLSKIKMDTLYNILGEPGSCNDNGSTGNLKLDALLVSDDVGPFKVHGLKPAVDALRHIFSEIKQHDPDLYEQVRYIRMYDCSFPGRLDHGWGTAIDLNFGDELLLRGGKARSGLVRLYPYFHKERFFWAGEKAHLHFEPSEELIREWEKTGILNP